MKTKRLIYAGLAAMLFSSSLINVPAQVSAAESSSSSVTTNNKVTSESDTQAESDSAKSESSQSEHSQSIMLSKSSSTANNKKTEISSQTGVIARSGDTFGDSQGQPADMHEPSDPAWVFFIILRNGFNSQPSAEQYIAKENIKNAKFSSLKVLHPKSKFLGQEPASVTRWHWDSTSQTWINDKISDAPKISGDGLFGWLGGYYKTDEYSMGDLGVGDYYYQFKYTDDRSKDYYTNLAKVVVTPIPIPATAIDTDTNQSDGTPKVIYSDVEYGAQAVMTPSNSTDNPTWKVTSDDSKLTFSPDTGRGTQVVAGDGSTDSAGKYTPDSYYTTAAKHGVNTNPNVAGISAKYKVTAREGVSKEKEVYVGGLPAFNGAADGGGSWQVGGLADLVKASGATGSWHYKWNFTDASGKAITTPTTAEGVMNTEGDITTLTNLNTEQPLTFAKDSSFMKKAAIETAKGTGKSYRAQLTLSTKVSADTRAKASNDTTITVVSNLGELQATPATGKLTLDSVPDFSFGNVTAASIYEGTAASGEDVTTATPEALKVTDSRATSGWSLSAQMSKMTSGTDDLSSAVINMTGLPDTATAQLADTGSATKILEGNKSISAPITGKLALTANPNLNLTKDENFKSNITWTLTSTAPVTKALK